MSDLTLIIPAKNESESLPNVLNDLKSYDHKINIILHSSDSSTIEAIKNHNIEIIYQKNLGYGDALIEGINQCKTKFFCIFNADGSFDPEEISIMVDNLNSKKLDFVFGSRYEKNAGSEDDTLVTLVGNFIFTKIGNIFFRLPISDILYTFVLGKTELAKKLDLKQKDFSFCVELPIKAQRNKMKMGSISCYEKKRIAGKKKVHAFKDGLKILLCMIKLFFINK